MPSKKNKKILKQKNRAKGAKKVEVKKSKENLTLVDNDGVIKMTDVTESEIDKTELSENLKNEPLTETESNSLEPLKDKVVNKKSEKPMESSLNTDNVQKLTKSDSVKKSAKKASKDDKVKTSKDKTKTSKKEKKPSKLKRKIKEVFSELKKVIWPTFPQIVKKTTTVIVVVLVFAVVLLGIDTLLELAHSWFFGKLN